MPTSLITSFKTSDYFISGIENDVVTISNYTKGSTNLTRKEALEMGNVSKLRGVIGNDLVACLRCDGRYNADYYFKNGTIFRYTDSKYEPVNKRACLDDLSVSTLGNYLVVYNPDYYVCVKSSLLEKGYNIVNIELFTVADGRTVLCVQGTKNYNYNTVQTVYNQVFLVDLGCVTEVYSTDDKGFEKMASLYKEVPGDAKDINSIRQRITNSMIKSKLERLTLAKIGNTVILGDLEINLGGYDGIKG